VFTFCSLGGDYFPARLTDVRYDCFDLAFLPDATWPLAPHSRAILPGPCSWTYDCARLRFIHYRYRRRRRCFYWFFLPTPTRRPFLYLLYDPDVLPCVVHLTSWTFPIDSSVDCPVYSDWRFWCRTDVRIRCRYGIVTWRPFHHFTVKPLFVVVVISHCSIHGDPTSTYVLHSSTTVITTLDYIPSITICLFYFHL